MIASRLHNVSIHQSMFCLPANKWSEKGNWIYDKLSAMAVSKQSEVILLTRLDTEWVGHSWFILATL